MERLIIFLMALLPLLGFSRKHSTILLEAENFDSKGGWVVDQQSMDQMGSPYVLAHGLGRPVEDAQTSIDVNQKGTYHVWVRTRDWVAQWNAKGAPGRFQLLIDGKANDTTFGTKGKDWHWHKGTSIALEAGKHEIALHDLTGFDGRCDAIVLTTDGNFTPPNEGAQMADFRRRLLYFPKKPQDAGKYDLVVVGGGMAGTCAAISAARYGLKVALIQDRPVLGGNNSSEVRVGLSGLINQEPYPKLGNLVDEIGPIGHWNIKDAEKNPQSKRSKEIMAVIAKHPEKKEHNAGPASNYRDDKKRAAVEAERNISLFLNTHVDQASTKDGKIVSVTGKHILSGKTLEFYGTLFVDCTGDGTLGYLAGADFRVGRESKKETGEIRAPEEADQLVMGTSVQWNTKVTQHDSKFPECPWAVQFDESNCHYVIKGDWNWEAGARRDQIEEIELIRDHAMRVVYGNWDYIKNRGEKKAKFANRELSWVAYIGGKRESRRILGDIILNEKDILNRKIYEDACFTTTWGIDLHYPVEAKGLDIEPYRSRADIKEIKPYPVPYRCLYSRNVDNLFMAGRNISVTHVALGTVRVMRTTGIMGEVVGMAASICIEKNTLPRGVYKNHLSILDEMMTKGVGRE
ncbi:FAD-dependent oxidoreductase [Puteibacter caeruleilacunae]|nr:FAD-dependent oxidoreductase [Puteibacter caeruleilacunae]